MNNILITAANSKYFDSLKTLISSIHKTSYDIVDEIIIYDLGLDVLEIDFLNGLEKCKTVNIKNAYLGDLPFDEFLDPTCYAFKCFCLVDARKYGENIFWLDSGACALQSIYKIFEIIKNDEIFCVGDKHLNKNYTSYKCSELMSATETELNDTQLSAGIIGYKKNGKHQHIFDKAYEFSKIKDCIIGHENNHRHDQSIFSILMSRFNIVKQDIDIYGYWTDYNRNIDTAIMNNAVIFVHRRGHNDTKDLKLKK